MAKNTTKVNLGTDSETKEMSEHTLNDPISNQPQSEKGRVQDSRRETTTTLKVKANSATQSLTLSSLRVVCIKCGKLRHPDEVACCLKTGPYQLDEVPLPKMTQTQVKIERLPPPTKEDPNDQHFFQQLE